VVTPGVFIDPLCGCTADPVWGVAPLPVDLDGYPVFGSPTSWHWDFGDGATSDMRTAQHTFAAGTYFVALTGIEGSSEYPCLPPGRRSLRVTALPQDAVGVDLLPLPADVSLVLAGAQPSSGEAKLAFELPHAGRVRLTVLDLAGRRVATLLDEFREAGRHPVSWRGLTDGGAGSGAGVYLAVLQYEGVSRTIRIVRIR
jgi:hypothetical protein